MALQPLVGPWPPPQFRNFLDSGTTWRIDQPVARPLLSAHRTQTQNKRTQRHPFEPTIPEFERAKTVHALDHATTVIGTGSI
jgi:hypothetical protein